MYSFSIAGILVDHHVRSPGSWNGWSLTRTPDAYVVSRIGDPYGVRSDSERAECVSHGVALARLVVFRILLAQDALYKHSE